MRKTLFGLAVVGLIFVGVPVLAKTSAQTISDSLKSLFASKTMEFSGSIEYSTTVDKKWLKLKKNAVYAPFYKDKQTKVKISGALDSVEENNTKFWINVVPGNKTSTAVGSAEFNGLHILGIGQVYYFLADVSFNGDVPNWGSFDINTIINNWIEVDKESVTELKDNYGGSYSYVKKASDVQEQNTFDETKLKELAKLYNIYKPLNVVRLADGKINSKSARHYRLTINAKATKIFLRQAIKKIDGLSLAASDLKQLDTTVTQLQSTSVDFWLDKKTDKLLQITFKNTATQKSTKYSPTTTGVLKITINFDSIDEPVVIEKPNYTFRLEDLIQKAVDGAKVKATDSKRLSDLKQIQTALELYYTDKDAYPTGNNITLGVENATCLNLSGWQPTYCVSPYMGLVPKDPGDNAYVYTSLDGTTYIIVARLDGTVNDLSGNIGVTPLMIADLADMDGIK